MSLIGWRRLAWEGTASLLLMVLFGALSRAQGPADQASNAMPKAQREMLEQVGKFNERDADARRLKNRLAKKETLAELKADQLKWLADLNKRLATEGALGWV